jgi:hypothetical protein
MFHWGRKRTKTKNMSEFPRTLLLTAWPPDGHYAGAEAMRRLLRVLPSERVLWCSLKATKGPLSPEMPSHKAIVAPTLHWRLRNGIAGYVWDFDLMPRRLARKIITECRTFKPEVIWVLPELQAIPVGYQLARRCGLPLHATVYDAPESAGDICVPRGYFMRYMNHARRFCRQLASADAVSVELLSHIRKLHASKKDMPGIAIPPSVPAGWMYPPRMGKPWTDDGRRVIGFCGSFRVTDSQWAAWLAVLGSLPWQIELLAFASPDTIPKASLPSNVSWRLLPYVDDECEIAECFVKEGVHACYLGLRRSPQWLLFNSTSLSSKLATYLSAAVPVIVDAPEDSVAWRLVRQYKAGVWLDDGVNEESGSDHSREVLLKLFSDEFIWRSMAAGSARLCSEEFDLGTNSAKLASVLARVVSDHEQCELRGE